jgi:aminoglycoside phosphotransferase (APT) family kinase protein
LQPSDVERAVAAAMSVASAIGLAARDAVVLHNSNNLAVRLLPCDVFARVAPRTYERAQFEVELAQRLAEAGSPVAALEPRAEPRPYEQGDFVITLWTYYASVTPNVAPADYASALARLHAGMRGIEVTSQHFTYRVAEAERLLAGRDLTPALAEADRALLSGMLTDLRRMIAGRGAPEQLLHGEPHPGNLIAAKDGPVFIDLETCCRGPVEFDLAHTPDAVARHYPGVDQELLGACRGLVLAMVAAWRWDARDQFPNGPRVGRELISTLRQGPPWPTLDAMMARLD